jgi:hypothetical protein
MSENSIAVAAQADFHWSLFTEYLSSFWPQDAQNHVACFAISSNLSRREFSSVGTEIDKRDFFRTKLFDPNLWHPFRNAKLNRDVRVSLTPRSVLSLIDWSRCSDLFGTEHRLRADGALGNDFPQALETKLKQTEGGL